MALLQAAGMQQHRMSSSAELCAQEARCRRGGATGGACWLQGGHEHGSALPLLDTVRGVVYAEADPENLV
jgi:hypothetical protein